MNKLIFVSLTFCLLLVNSAVPAQCNNELVEIAMAESGTDAVYLDEFKVKFTGNRKAKPAPVARFNTMLNEGKLYRFTVANAREYEGRAILQLYRSNILIGSTYDPVASDDSQTFDYLCESTGFYRILMSFIDGKEGCAAGVMSLVINDSTRTSDPVLLGQDTVETLFLHVENPLSLAVTDALPENVEVSIDNGRIIRKNGFFSAFVDHEGSATIIVTVKDTTGAIREESSFRFNVKSVPFPTASIGGMTGGIADKDHLIRAARLEAASPAGFENLKYTVIRFTVSSELERFSGIASSGRELSFQQINYIRDLEPGTKLFFKDILVNTPDGSELKLEPLGFILN